MVKGLLERARDRFPAMELREVNWGDHAELALRYGVFSTPALVINGRLEFTGIPKEKKLLARLEALSRTGTENHGRGNS